MQQPNQKEQATEKRKWVTDSYLAEYYAVDRTTIWRWAKKGLLPSPQKFGENTTRFDFEAIQKADSESTA